MKTRTVGQLMVVVGGSVAVGLIAGHPTDWRIFWAYWLGMLVGMACWELHELEDS